MTSTMTGIAQQEGIININNKFYQYIGTGWKNETIVPENQITCKNLLTMTSGLEHTVDDVTPAKLIYKADTGTRWVYHNVYLKLQDVIANASGQSWSNYFNSKLRDKKGMSVAWFQVDNNSVYFSNTRSADRFG
ncbi:serine hydrolase [Flavobacterium cellulosilyticum]|uniref:serine hydrolase n=1 Tax=Flavobacterium cellulosilyticum TaxID=2541731 RepID=UPI00319E6AEB